MKHPRAICVLLIAGACGGQASNPRPGTEPFTPASADEVETTELPGPPVATPEPGPTPTAPEPAAPPEPPRYLQLSPYDLRAQAVVLFLGQICASCLPRPATDLPEAWSLELGILAGLIAQGDIIPGDRSASPLWQRLNQGPLPPGSSREPTSGELAVLGELIDQLPAQPEPDCVPLPFLGHDEVLEALAADLRSTNSPATTRYLSLTYASNAGVCGSELERHRSALFKQVNSLSSQPAIAVPRAVDANGLLYRIDVRDYGWDRPIDLEDDGDIDFADAWLAITATAGVYGQEFAGPEADVLTAGTQTAVPLLSAHVLTWAPTIGGDLYYSLTGAHANANETRAALGIDVVEASDRDQVRRAGFLDGYRDVMVLRFEQASGGRGYWRLSEDDLSDSETVLGDPLNLRGAGLSISQLPNGLLAFGIETDDGSRLNAVPVCSVLDCPGNQLGSLVACHACHEHGLLPARDIVRGFAEENRQQYDNDTFTGVRAQYPGVEAFQQLIGADNQLTRAALEATGVVRAGPEPVSYVSTLFELGSVDLRTAAAELGVTTEAFRERGGMAVPQWQALADPAGVIDRQVFTNQYSGALCTLHAAARNRPVSCR